MRARTHIEDMDKGGRQAIIIDELPYQVNKAQLLIKIGEMVREKRLEGIADLRDESDKSGMRAVIELKRGEVAEIVLNNLYKAHADAGELRHEHGRARRRPAAAAQPAAVPGRVPAPPPRGRHAAHRVRPAQGARTRPRARGTRRGAVQRGRGDRDHQGGGDARRPRRASSWDADWRSTLVEEMLARATAEQFRPEALPKDFGLLAGAAPGSASYRLSDVQAQRILEMQLQRLTGLEQDKILSEYREVIATIEDLLDILAKPGARDGDHRGRARGDQARVRRQAPQRDRGERPGPADRGPDRARERGGHALARGLHQEPAAGRVPRAEARRARQAGHHHQGRRLRREALHREHPRLRAVLLEQGQARTGSRSTRSRRAAARAAASRS